MKKDVYKDIEEALLAQNFLDDEDFAPDTEAFNFKKEKPVTSGSSSSLLDGSTTMYLDAVQALNTTSRTKADLGKIDKVQNMETTDFLGETDFLGYTDYMEGKRIRSHKDSNDSYEVSGDENDNPFRNVFGLGPKKKKQPAKSSSGQRHQANGRDANPSTGKQMAKGVAKGTVKGAAKGTSKAASAGQKAVSGVIHFIQLLVRVFCFILMLACAFQIGDGCYYHKDDLGSAAMMIPNRNYALISFLVIAILAVLYAVISACRILTARRRIEEGREINGDYGQGFFPFLLFLLLGIAAFVLPDFIPQMNELEGFRLFLNVIHNRGTIFLQINAIGALLCMARKLTHGL